MARLIDSYHDATLKQVLERLDKQEAQQLNLLNKLENDIERLFDITSHHTDLIEKQERILNRDKVTLNKIILD